jgi:hypothetical protein
LIFELSKNKSLHYLLSKVDLDEETSKLVEENASASLIKMSLENNINSSNLIVYRKYIIKADEKDKEEKDRIRDEGELGSESLDDVEEQEQKDSETVGFGQSRRDANLRAAKKETNILGSTKKKKALSDAQEIKRMVEGMEAILSTATIEESNGKLTIKQGGGAFRQIAPTAAKSNKLIKLIQEVKPEYLEKLFTGYIATHKDGYRVFDGFTSKKDKDTKEIQETPSLSRSVNIDELQSKLNALVEEKHTYKGQTEPLILRMLGLLHIKTFKYTPLYLKDTRRYKNELNDIRRLTMGKSPVKVGVGEKVLNKIKSLDKQLFSLQYILEDTYTNISTLNAAKKDITKLVERKINRLVTSYRTLIAEKKIDKEDFKRMKNLLDELNKNPAAYEDEAREEIEQDIDAESRKLDTYIQKIESITPLKEVNSELKMILNDYDKKISIQAVNVILSKILNAQVKTNVTFKKLNTLLEKNQDKITLGVSSYLQDSADSSQLTMDSEGIDYEGMATVSVEFNSKVDKLTEKINGYTEIVRAQTTELRTLIFGEGQ